MRLELLQVAGDGKGGHGGNLGLVGLPPIGSDVVSKEREAVAEEDGFGRVHLEPNPMECIQHLTDVLDVLFVRAAAYQHVINVCPSTMAKARTPQCIVSTHLELSRAVDAPKGKDCVAQQTAVCPELCVFAAGLCKRELVKPSTHVQV